MKNLFFFKTSVFKQAFFSMLFIPAFLAGFLLAPSVSASTYSKLITQSSGPACEYVNKTYGEKIFGQSFLSTSTNLTAIALRVSRMDANSVISEIRICQGLNQELIATTTIDKSLLSDENSPLTWVRIPFSSTKRLIPGDDYFFSFFGYQIVVGADFYNEGAYPDGWATGANVTDLSFRTFYDTGLKKNGKIKIAVVLAETKDVKHLSSSITAQPCKLIPEKTYSNGHDKEYYEDLFYCVKDYHCENSFGKMNEQGDCEGGLVDLEFEFYDNNGEWYKIDKARSEYATENGGPYKEELVVNDIKNVIDIDIYNNYNAGLFVVSGISGQHNDCVSVDCDNFFSSSVVPNSNISESDSIITSENDNLYYFVHEIMHYIGISVLPEDDKTLTPDLYDMGHNPNSDIMAETFDDAFNDPILSNSYTKEFLQWFT